MIPIKKKEEIMIMKRAGHILADVLGQVCDAAIPGVTELELDHLAEKLILERGGEPGFKKVPGYSHTICVATNDVVVHGIPTKRVLKDGDIIGIDCGVYLDGFHTDMAETVELHSAEKTDKNTSGAVSTFLRIGKEAMWAGIKQVRDGNRVGHISRAVQEIIEGAGYSVVRDLIGH